MIDLYIQLILMGIAVIGAMNWCDGLASIWAYWKKDDETFWRNHSLRVLRMISGVILMASAGGLIYLIQL